MAWRKVSEELPTPFTEVQVWINGKRGPSWRNNHHLVAYVDTVGNFWEERHPSDDPLAVIAWDYLNPPFEE